MYLLKGRVTQKPSKTTWKHLGTIWNKPENNWNYMKPAKKQPISSEMSHIL